MELEKRHIDLINLNQKDFFDNGSFICVILNTNGEISYVNRAFLDLTGYDEFVKGKKFLELFTLAEEKVDILFNEIISGKEEKTDINHILCRNGDKKLILWHNHSLKNEKGEIEYVLSIGDDITFRSEYQHDIRRINEAFLSLSRDYEKNLKNLLNTAYEISGALACFYNAIENGKIKTIFSIGVPASFPKDFEAEGTPCKKLYDSNLDELEQDLNQNETLIEGAGKYYGILVKKDGVKFGVLCFFFKDERIKKERLHILSKAVAIVEENHRLIRSLDFEKNRYKDFFERMPFGVYVMSLPSKKIEYVNDMAYDLTGYTKQELYEAGGEVIERLVHEEDRPKLYDFLKSGDLFKASLRLRWIKKDGTVIWTERTFSPIYDENNKLTAVQAAVRDITAETKYNEDINSYTKAILITSQVDAIFIKNKSEDVFPKLLDMLLSLTYSKYGFLGFLDENQNLVARVMTENVYGDCNLGDSIVHSMVKNSSSLWAKSLKEGKINILNGPGNAPAGHIKIDSAVSIPLSYGSIVYGVILLAGKKEGYSDKDISLISKIASHMADRVYTILENQKLKEKEEKIRQDMTNAMRLESLGTLAGGIGHDFNNLLSAVTANLSLLAERVSGENRDIVEDSIKAADSAKSLASQLMFLAKGYKPLRQKTDSTKFLRDTFNFLSRGIGSVKTKIEIDENLSAFEIDRGQITQVISNMLINASQALAGVSNPRIDIKVQNYIVSAQDKSNMTRGNYVKISIRDNGCGIDSENIKRIFDPYFTTKKTGSGLGLYIAYGVIVKHSGYIEVKSEKGKGSEFIIYIPALSETFNEAKETAQSASFRKLNILILDDEEIVLKSLSRIIKSLGHDCFIAKKSYEAETIVSNDKVDIAFVDLTLKGDIDGYAVNAKLKQIKPEIYTIVSSGYSEQGLGDYMSKGFDAAMPKPYKFEDVKRMISGYLDRK